MLLLALPLSLSLQELFATCYAFGKLEIRTFTSNRFKNQTNNMLKLLGQSCSYQQGLLNKKLLLSIVAVLI